MIPAVATSLIQEKHRALHREPCIKWYNLFNLSSYNSFVYVVYSVYRVLYTPLSRIILYCFMHARLPDNENWQRTHKVRTYRYRVRTYIFIIICINIVSMHQKQIYIITTDFTMPLRPSPTGNDIRLRGILVQFIGSPPRAANRKL